MSEAATEGMAGGERNKLHDVLVAKDELSSLSVSEAYDVVLRDLQTRLNSEVTPETRTLVQQALVPLEKLRHSFVLILD